MKKYILLYSNEKPEDNICLLNMFKENKYINIGNDNIDITKNIKIIDKLVQDKYEEIIFAGFETGWDKLIDHIKLKYPKIIVNVICNTQDSLLYYDYERENFFKMLEYSRKKYISKIAFLRKGQYELYKSLGYNCYYLKQNFILNKDENFCQKEKDNEKISLGFYPLNYSWDKNIFNQLCVCKFLENSTITYNLLDSRMFDFLNTMKIPGNPVKIKDSSLSSLIQQISMNDVVISTSFTEYMHPIFFISMELGVPCLCGNNSDLFEPNEELKKYIVTSAEDNAIINSKLIENILENKDTVIELYKKWKENYNKAALKSITDFIG